MGSHLTLEPSGVAREKLSHRRRSTKIFMGKLKCENWSVNSGWRYSR
jgi:hypothetical protein